MSINVLYEDGIPFVKGEFKGKTYTLTERGRDMFATMVENYGFHKDLIFKSICETDELLTPDFGFIPMTEAVIVEEF